jgi:hypothetical protein
LNLFHISLVFSDIEFVLRKVHDTWIRGWETLNLKACSEPQNKNYQQWYKIQNVYFTGLKCYIFLSLINLLLAGQNPKLTQAWRVYFIPSLVNNFKH